MKRNLDKIKANVVDLRDLLTLNIEDKSVKKRKKKRLIGHAVGKVEKRWVEAELPLTIEEQLEKLHSIAEEEQSRRVRPEDLEKISNLYSTLDVKIDPPSEEYMIQCLKKIPDKVKQRKEFPEKKAILEAEIVKDYEEAIKSSIVQTLLQDENKRAILGIETMPIGYPVLLVRTPVPWHQTKVIAEQLMEYNLFIGNEIIKNIGEIWHNKYRTMMVVRIEDFGKLPIPALEIRPKIKLLCEAAINKITKEWLAEVAELFLDKKEAWSKLFDKNPSSSTGLVEKYFKCVNSLLSRQLRIILLQNIRHLRDYFVLYKEGNAFSGEYDETAFTRTPLMRISVEPVFGTQEFRCEPTVPKVYSILSTCFNAIIHISSMIPKIEVILFPDIIQKSSLFPVSRKEREVNEILSQALNAIKANVPGPQIYMKCYEDLGSIIDGSESTSLDEFFKQDPFPGLHDFSVKIKSYTDLIDKIWMFRNKVSLNMIELDCTNVNDVMRQILYDLRTRINDYFREKLRNNNRDLCSIFDEIANRISEMPESTQDVVDLYNYLCECRDNTLFNLKSQFAWTGELLLFLYGHLATFENEDIYLTTRTLTWPREMEMAMELANSRLNMRKEFVEGVLKNKRENFEKKIRKQQHIIDQFKKKDPPVLTPEEMESSTAEIEKISQTMTEIRREAESINSEEALLDLEISPYITLPSLTSTVENFDRMWHIVLEFHYNYNAWMYGPFQGIDADEVRDQTDNTWRTLYKLSRSFSDVPGARRIAELIRGKVEKFRQFMPLLQTICNPGLQPRHWKDIGLAAGVPIKLTPMSNLSQMIDLGLMGHVAKIEEISTSASKEHALEKNLRKMQEEWSDISFDLMPYRETGVQVLSSVDDIQLLLDDHILKAQTMRGSPYVKAFEKEMQAWEEKLITMQDIIDQWLICQATWMYLEPIFSSEDIMRQMPIEAKSFRKVDKIWRGIMAFVGNNPKVLIATGKPNMLKDFRKSNTLLEQIQKGLNDYLEKKRLFFPRFFFLSNDELLEILSETKDPHRVEPHLKKCFEGITSLRFTKDEEIIGMLSEEEEYVPMSGKIYPADAKGMVEKWLSQVEELMRNSLRDIVQEAIVAYFTSIREEWIIAWPGQLVLCASQVHWTSEVCESFDGNSTSEYLLKCNNQINKTVALVRGKLEPGSRITLNALIVIDVHARDVVKLLLEKNVSNATDFSWIAQLRYYWLEGSVGVCMISTEIAYGFEYLGNSPRLVITPLTDRCYRTLMGALKLNLGGAPEGPAGTGKTETSKDLAKAVAKQCVVFNCSEGLDFAAMGKFFKGVAQAGAWACFDEFNRIDLEVLSVIAQQILTIQNAIAQNVEKFMFEGTELRLNPTCTVIITMNPGYAGRQELPDNLKVLFRTVAMMVPDYGMIGEITLYSYGFVHARVLANKIVHTYKLCSEQLSSQSHYDYGMRAVKTVLLAAGNLKLKYQEEQEAILVLRAIVDVNLPKFLAQDIPLFCGIYSDLFPGVKLPNPDRDELINLLVLNLEKKNLQPTKWYMEKIIQVYEMILVRHGLMVVGETLGGKTQAYQSLAEALGEIALVKNSTIREFRTIYRIINPKAITLGQLYGSFDPISHEWSDGVLANTFREYAQSITTERKWILFDGPVDAVWIENMNTVLDDNKKLCLMSGEIIQMSSKMNMIFEPEDLEQASPATVSRCGMIYLEPSQLGWVPLFESYKKHLKEKLLLEQFELVVEIIEWLIEPILMFVKRFCRTFINVSELYIFLSFTKMLSMMLEGETQVSTMWLQGILMFCIVWGLCPTLVSDSRKNFDVFFRKVLLGNDEDYPRPKAFKLTKQQLFPERGTVFDWVYDKRNNGSWISWMDTMTQNPPSPQAKASDLIIQTPEMSMQRFFLAKLMKSSIPILFVGPTGTGKSAIALNYMLHLSKDKYIQNIVNFSARTTAYQTQEIIMSKLDRRRKGVYGPAMGKKCILFVDDLSMPQLEIYGAQPPVELLRQWIDHGHWFDPKDTSILQLVDIYMIAAMAPPGGASNRVTARFLRHLYVIGIDAFEDSTMTKIYGSILEWHFAKGFGDNIARLNKMILAATMEVYRGAMLGFLPTPAKSHYTFNLRDFSRVISGILLVPASRMKDPEKLIRLWIHEIYRVFNDRLIDDDDREKLFQMIKHACHEHLRQPIDKMLAHLLPEGVKEITPSHIGSLFFGNYMEPDADPKIYDEVSDFDDLQVKMDFYLADYNTMSKSPMSLVLFRSAIEHVSRISRILLQDKGHAMLVGMGGSGRNSCARLATSMCEYILHQIEITRTYGRTEWRDDLNHLLMRVGCDGKPTAFLLNDTQIKDESFLEDVSILLNTGDVPNLFGSEEKAEILEKMTSVARETQGRGRGAPETSPMALYNLFIERVKQNLHVVLCMSPIGDAFRTRLRMFPSLINCCTIDWYTAWPPEALTKVAKKFLENLAINQDIREKCVTICQHFHVSVHNASIAFLRTHHKRNYVTPTSYLQLIKCLYKFYGLKVEDITKQQFRYLVGLDKLDFAAGQVGLMQEELTALQPQLIAQSQKSDKLMIKIEQDTVNVEAKKEVVAADEALANEAAAAAQAIKDDCESDLAEATPALEAALAALDTLKPADITIIKSMKSPPAGVRLVLEAVCVLKGVKPDRVQDPKTLLIVEDYWPPSVRLLGDIRFLDGLRNFDKDSIPLANIKRIREKFMNDRGFQPDVVKKVSTACEGLCRWVRAMEVYDRVIKVVAPKKAMLADAEAELALQMETLNAKRGLLQEVSDKLQQLNDEFAECMREKKKLEDLIELCIQKLDRAEKLLGGLGGEKKRWSETAATLGASLENVIGDILLASGTVAYLGAFTMEYRDSLVDDWHAQCKKIKIPCSPPPFSLLHVLGDPVEVRAWLIQGLPADKFSVENGIIVRISDRWPLMIDPQVEANKWIKNMEKANRLSIIKLTDANYTRVLETAIQLGLPVLLENILEDIDAVLEPILSKNIYTQRGVSYIRFAESVLEYNPDFRLYITTRLRNPHYLPEIAVKVCLLNFTITPQGLQDQLLGIVVARELPVLEQKKNQLIVESANNKRILKELEDKILEVLSTSEGNILEDETAIKILSSSKTLSEEIRLKQVVAAETSKEIDDARDGYKPVSHHGATLFFCISELANIDPMYQYSLAWFIRLFISVIGEKHVIMKLQERIKFLNNAFTATIYRNVCRSLFEKDKLIFSLTLCVGIMKAEHRLQEDLWIFLLTGGVALESPPPNPDPSWLTDKSWSEIFKATALNGLQSLKNSVQQNTASWQSYYDLTNPQEKPLPAPFDKEKGGSLKRLVIIRCLRPDKLVIAIRSFVIQHMGQNFVEPPPFELLNSYNDSNNVTPLVFVLSPGSDPMAGLMKFAEDRGIEKNALGSISLGQGQGPIAANAINNAIKTGEWLVLQNCHLAESWMKELNRICDEVIVPANTHSAFRLWLTSYPSKAFPVSILQNAVKMTNEAPKGLRNNLARSYASDPISDDKFFKGCKKLVEWRSLLFSICFFHAVVQERRTFGPLGWNIPYEFNESDLRISLRQLQMFLNEYIEVPFEALLYLIGECNYGGRVTDDKDRRLLASLLTRYLNPKVVEVSDYSFSPSGLYRLPPRTDYNGCIEYIRTLPMTQTPEVFGLHENADITKDNRESMQLLAGALLTQSSLLAAGAGGEGEGGNEQMVFDLASDILERMPDMFNLEEVKARYPVLYMNSMNTVLRQELIRFNRLIVVIKSDLRSIKKGVKGLIAMSPSMEDTYASMCIGRVPDAWESKSYPTLKPLTSYVADLIQRLNFLQNWIDHDAPSSFWLSGFFFTQSFLTGVLQNYARKHTIPIDHLDFEFETTALETSSQITETPEFGVYVYGLFLEGARWNREIGQLDESLPKVMFDTVPIIWLKPGIKADFVISNVYFSPLYKTSARRGVLATTGHSSNFVMFILLATEMEQSHWIDRGTACLCQLDD